MTLWIHKLKKIFKSHDKDEEAKQLTPQEDHRHDQTKKTTKVHSETESHYNLAKVETTKSLEDLGMDVDAPETPYSPHPVSNPVFPEEYTIETPTGLVPAGALAQLGRVKSVVSHLSKEEAEEKIKKLGLTEDEVK